METILDTKLVNKMKKTNPFLKRFYSERYLFLMSLPFVAWLVIFKYVPIWGWIMAFQEYSPGKSIFQQKWVGLKHFIYLFQDEQFYIVMRNTLVMGTLGLVAGTIFAIAFAVLLNEIRHIFFKRSIQTITYLPHFVSWVIIAGMFSKLLSTDGGAINDFLVYFGFIHEPIQFMSKGNLFWAIITIVDTWKETGWSSIIYLAAIAGISQELYEAAISDGAGRFRCIWNVTLPCIRPTIIVMLIMNIGWLISIGFEKQFLMGNDLVTDFSQVVDLYVLQYGIGMSRFSYGTAVGIFKSLVSVLLLFSANTLARKYDEGRLL